ncbi:hypothetical protein HJG60_008794 [Phyllostomus discolor]|uniref:Uncharacterized protein n=1 Tax=Phyllostomus discolor TaxID=89673 RepID=A0A834DFW9_9CHIR|nr:hypothetical protein HJG60_008794 [Phyllostomus discolor]
MQLEKNRTNARGQEDSVLPKRRFAWTRSIDLMQSYQNPNRFFWIFPADSEIYMERQKARVSSTVFFKKTKTSWRIDTTYLRDPPTVQPQPPSPRGHSARRGEQSRGWGREPGGRPTHVQAAGLRQRGRENTMAKGRFLQRGAGRRTSACTKISLNADLIYTLHTN